MTEEIKVQVSSGNVFADLELSNPDELLAKAELARQIAQIIHKRHLTQVEAAEMLGIDQPKVSALMKGKITGFSTERLFKFLNALGFYVEIVVKRKPNRNTARISCHAFKLGTRSYRHNRAAKIPQFLTIRFK